MLWVALRPTGVEPPYEVFAVTADPAEGEAWTEAGDDLVDVVPMPETVRATIDAFVAEHHVERAFHKRQRDRADPEALARRGPMQQNEMSEPENFIARWSRRKREQRKKKLEATKPAAAPGVPDETAHADDDRGQASGVPPARSDASEPPHPSSTGPSCRRSKRLPPRATSGRSSRRECRPN